MAVGTSMAVVAFSSLSSFLVVYCRYDIAIVVFLLIILLTIGLDTYSPGIRYPVD
jgi:hypothetical protein